MKTMLPVEEKAVIDDHAAPGRFTIMVVDDDESLQIYIKKVLEDDYNLVQASTPGQALNFLNNDLVDLVLLDLVLPDISGITLCRQIKNMWKDKRIPIVVLTARTDLETKIEALEAGADDYITKPFHPKELVTRLKVQLRLRELQKEIIRAERIKAIVATTISANHEINNPLCAIINNAELMMLLPAVRKNEEAMRYLDLIFGNAVRIEQTIQKMANTVQPIVSQYLPGVPMLDISRSGTGEKNG